MYKMTPRWFYLVCVLGFDCIPFDSGAREAGADTSSTDSSSTTGGSTTGTETSTETNTGTSTTEIIPNATSSVSSSTSGSENTSHPDDSASSASEDSTHSSGSTGGSESTSNPDDSESSASEDSSDTEESCSPHSTQCFDSMYLQTCTAEGIWGSPQPCDPNEACKEDKCVRICEPWIQQLGTAEADRGTGIAVDKFGNLYITGYTKGAFEGQNSGMEDIFIVKYDVHGIRLWGDQFGTGETDESRGVAVDKDGNAYISGYTLGALDSNVSNGKKDFFITKYNSKGKNRLWTKQGGATWSDASSGVVVDSSGAAYITGNRTQEREDKSLIFVAKYVEVEKEDAEEAWSKSVLKSDVNGSGHDVALDGQGNIYISGSAVGTGGEPRLRDIVIAKYDSDGDQFWNKHMGTPEGDEAHGIAVDSQGNAYITGFRGATLDELDEDEKVGLDIFVSKYATDGKHIWSEVLVTNENDYGTAVALDVEGNVYITGYTDGVLDDNGAKGGRDIFVAKYNADGSERWVQQIGTTSTEEGSDIVIGGDGNIYITGYTDGALGKAHSGSDDIFIAKVCEDKS